MNNNTNCDKVVHCEKRSNNGVLIIIVLYILLAIILGSYWY